MGDLADHCCLDVLESDGGILQNDFVPNFGKTLVSDEKSTEAAKRKDRALVRKKTLPVFSTAQQIKSGYGYDQGKN